MKRQLQTEQTEKSRIAAFLLTMMMFMPMMAYAGNENTAPKTHESVLWTM